MRSDESDKRALEEFLKRNRGQTLAEWERAVRHELAPAANLDLNALEDHMPALLDAISEGIGDQIAPGVEDLPDEHARVRLDQGFSLEQIAREFQFLRSALLRLAQAEPVPLPFGALLILNDAIDRAVGRSVARYHETRSRTLEALERISQEAFASEGGVLRDFLRRFLAIILDTVEPIDTAVIYIREWDRLVVRAAVGLETAIEEQFSLRIGEGIAGMVAAQRRPYFTPSAATDPLVRNQALVFAGVKALYAVPLVFGGDLIGVAKVGSRTASEFSPEDRQLFQEMAQRVAVVVSHRKVAEERELFLGVLSHDMRSPLSTILMGANYLLWRREQLSEPVTRTVQRIASAGQRLDRMISDLATYTKVRFGIGFTMERRLLDLRELLQQLLGELRAQATDRELRLELDGDLVGEWDRVRLGQIVTNLVSNAMAYGDPSAAITISAAGSNAHEVVLQVHNEGTPIPGEALPQIFEPFKRGPAQGRGMGLGLYIVRHIAQAHGGSVDVESAAERGTTFHVHLPRWMDEARARAAPANGPPAQRTGVI